MNRRSFLGNLFKAAVITTIAPSILAEIQAVENSWKTYCINGYTIKVMHNPIFDDSTIIHPVTSSPLESYRMIFINNEDIYPVTTTVIKKVKSV